MTDQYLYKNTIRHRKNNQWLQRLETQENDTKMKIFKFQENCHKPSLLKELEMFFKVTPCNEKCNFFILLSFNLLKSISLLRIFLIGIIRLRRVRISLLVQFLNILFCRRGFRSPILTFLMKTNMSNQWIRKIENDTKFVTVTNSCYIKKTDLNPV